MSLSLILSLLLSCKCHKINHNCSGSHVDSPDWIENEKATINPINKKDKCFQYAVTVALNHKEIKKQSQGTTKIQPFVNKYNWEDIQFPSEKKLFKKV